jgi:hypothetical protein
MFRGWRVAVVMRRAATFAGVAALAGLGARSASAAAEPTLLGQWRFDEADGQVAVDDGPQRLNGLLGAHDSPDAADPVRVAGASGRALRFDGKTFVRLPDTGALAVPTLTAEAVVRADGSPGSYRYLVSRGGRDCLAGSFALYTGQAGGIALYVFDGTRYLVSATARPADVWNGAWHHISGSFDGRALRIFVDGRPVGAPVDAPLRIEYAGMSPRASFGQYVGACELSFRGDMDTVRLWSGARSQKAIVQDADDIAPGAAGLGPLTAADEGTVIPAQLTPSASRRRGCVVRVVRKRARGKRVTVVKVRVTKGVRPVRAARVVARRAGRKQVLARGRTDATGRARLAVRSRRSMRVSITAQGRPRCAPGRLYVRNK